MEGRRLKIRRRKEGKVYFIIIINLLIEEHVMKH